MRQKVIAAAAVLLVALFAGAAHIVSAQTATAGELRSQLQAKYDIVALQQGVGLVPKQPNARARMIEVANGNVVVDGMTLTAAQLRDRVGADAGPIVQLTYLSAAEQRQLASPEDQAGQSELAGAMARALAKLRPEYRDVVVLRYQEGLTQPEVADALGIPSGTVKTYLHRARKELAEILVAEGFGPTAETVFPEVP